MLAPIRMSELDTLVLGCTHFPILAAEIKQLLGQSVILLDSGRAVADRVLNLLKANGLIKTESNRVVDYSAVFTTGEIAKGLKERLVEEGFTSIEPHSSTNLR